MSATLTILDGVTLDISRASRRVTFAPALRCRNLRESCRIVGTDRKQCSGSRIAGTDGVAVDVMRDAKRRFVARVNVMPQFGESDHRRQPQ